MPELRVDFITTLDGYGAADGWPGWWGLEGPEYLAWLGEQPEAGYTVLMGATTYRVMSGYAAEGEPGTDALAGMSKVVFSTTLRQPLSWANTQLVAHDPVEAVREMKDKGSRSMRTIGSRRSTSRRPVSGVGARTPHGRFFGAKVGDDDCGIDEYVAGRAFGDHPTELEGDQPVADAADHRHVVLDDEHRTAGVLADAEPERPAGLGLLLCHTAGRL